MSDKPTATELEAYLDEALPTEAMARIEQAIRNAPDLTQELAAINARRDAGVHSLGEIWRRYRISCPQREQLGSYLLGVLDPDLAHYVTFHLEVVGCRSCQANLEDLRTQQTERADTVDSRRRKYFQSSVGRLPKK
jgi:hypothetical protein